MEDKGLLQKLFTLFLILLVPVFIIANFSVLRSKRDVSASFRAEFIPKDEYLTEKAFVFILYTTDQNSSLEQNLQSIFSQKYDKYRVLILCTRAQEKQIAKLRQLAARENKSHLLQFVETDQAAVTVENYRQAIYGCKDEEIIIQIDTHDWLAHEHVLTRLNETHQNSSEIWLTYSQYLEYPSYKRGDQEAYVKRMLRNRNSRKIPYLSSHFKTYYAGLFKQIQPEVKVAGTKALDREHIDLYLLPMVELSKNHIRFIDDVLYIHNIL